MRTMTIAVLLAAGAVYAQEPPANMMAQVKVVTEKAETSDSSPRNWWVAIP